MVVLEPGHLDWRAVFTLGHSLREEDALECVCMSPFETLAAATTQGGQSFTAISGPHTADILGAFGYTDAGLIWSLWRELSREETFAVLRHTPLWVRTLVASSGRRHLHNWVTVANHKAINWLRSSRCFDIDDTEMSVIAGPDAFAFRTKLLEDLP